MRTLTPILPDTCGRSGAGLGPCAGEANQLHGRAPLRALREAARGHACRCGGGCKCHFSGEAGEAGKGSPAILAAMSLAGLAASTLAVVRGVYETLEEQLPLGGWRRLGHSGVTLTVPSAAFPSRGPDQETCVGPCETYSEDRLCRAKMGGISHPTHLTLDSACSQRFQLRVALSHHTMHRADPLRRLPGGQRRLCPAASACPSPRAGPPAELQSPGRAQRCPLWASIPQQRGGARAARVPGDGTCTVH